MARAFSPLRYPGGKTTLYPLVAPFLQVNNLRRRRYAEPFAGGAGLALALLYGGHVSDIHINDIDPSVWAFWYSALHYSEDLSHLVSSTPVTVSEWKRQKEIYRVGDYTDVLSLGFATFYLNRTNRSGVIKGAGVIGGLNQDGPYKIDCRFNRDDLIRRICRVAKYRKRIHLTNEDALEFIEKVEAEFPEKTFLFVDPPYLKKGADLYTNFYRREDHRRLSDRVLAMRNPWIVTYDNDSFISELYRERRQYNFDISYSLETKRKGTELLIVGEGLRLPVDLRSRQTNAPKRRAV